MATTWRLETSLLTLKRDSFTVDTVVWATPSPTRSSKMATPTTSKTNFSLTSSRERVRRTSKINRISRQISRQALLQGFLNFLGYLHFFLASYQLEEEVLYSRVCVCLRTMPKRFALSSLFSRARLTTCSNAASEACGSKIVGGWAKGSRRTP